MRWHEISGGKACSEGRSTAGEQRGSQGGEFIMMRGVAGVFKVGHGSKIKQKSEAQDCMVLKTANQTSITCNHTSNI